VSIKTRARASDAVCSSAEAGWLKVARGELADVKYPIISDPKRETAVLLGMLDEDEKDNAGA
jgi:alkyl hydroperoxide reductase subunit AhpC